jgi:hypothetical protein
MKKFKNRLYVVLLTMATTSNGTSELRIAANTQESHGSEYGQKYTPPDFPTP